jgi:hypothetical protein
MQRSHMIYGVSAGNLFCFVNYRYLWLPFSVIFYIFSSGQALFPSEDCFKNESDSKLSEYITEQCCKLIPPDCNTLLVAQLVCNFIKVFLN